MAKREAQLVLTLFDRVTGPAKGISATVGRLTSMLDRNTAALDQMRGRMMDAVGAGYALVKSISAPINAAMEFESAMADIKKVVDFPTPEGFAKLGKDIREMSLRIPMAADGIAQIVAAAGQSGIKTDELTAFAEMAAKVGVAWDISAGDAGEALAKLKTALGRSVEDTGALADAINHLGNNSAASAPQILDVVKRVAPMASQFGMTAEQVAAIAAAMTGAGFESEVAATSLLNVGRALTKGSSATPRVQAAFKKLGLTSKQVAKDMQKNAVGTLQDVLRRINKLPKEVRAAAISDLFGDEARALAPLIANGDLLADTLDLVSDRSKYLGSAQAEFETRAKTTANALQLFRNRISDLGITIGSALLPALNTMIDKIGPIITQISDLAGQYPELTAAIVATTSAIVAFNIAVTAARFAGLFMVGGILRSALAFTNLAGALSVVGGAIAAISAPALLAIGGAVGVVAAAGALMWKYWDRISAVVGGVARALGEQLAPVIQAVQPFIAPFAESFRALGDAAGWAWEKLSALGNWLGSFFEQEVLSEDQKTKIGNSAYDMTNRIIAAFKAANQLLVQAGLDMIQGLWDGAVQKFEELLAWFQTLPQRIVQAIGNIDLSNIIKWPSLPSWAGGGQPEQTQTGGTVAGAREKGGPVRGGSTYLVGERGPELFTPQRSGVITSNRDLLRNSVQSPHDVMQREPVRHPRDLFDQRSPSREAREQKAEQKTINAPVSVTMNVTINEAQNADRIVDELGRKLQERMSGIFADTNWSIA